MLVVLVVLVGWVGFFVFLTSPLQETPAHWRKFLGLLEISFEDVRNTTDSSIDDLLKQWVEKEKTISAIERAQITSYWKNLRDPPPSAPAHGLLLLLLLLLCADGFLISAGNTLPQDIRDLKLEVEKMKETLSGVSLTLQVFTTRYENSLLGREDRFVFEGLCFNSNFCLNFSAG